MSGFANPIIGGGGALVYPSIHSPDFSAVAETGWSINKDGTVEFSTLRITGATPLTVFLVVSNGHDVGEISFIDNGTGAFYLQAFSSFSVLMADPISAVDPASLPNPNPESWHNLSLTANWGAFAGFHVPRAELEPIGAKGRVRLSGVVQNNTGANAAIGTVFATLPPSYRPTATIILPCTGVNTEIQITNTGAISLNQAILPASDGVGLDGITFELD